jgi:HAD superfamily hydrolase (TIGR01484 family)
MRYLALITDYDGTIAAHGRVSEDTLDALGAVADSGRKLVLVTGRELPDLLQVFPEADIFDRIVAENGALMYRPDSREEVLLAEAPPTEFLTLLQRDIPDLAHGRVIVATGEPHEATVLEAIRQLGLELQVIFNKGSVMILPSGVNKASGLTAALEELALSAHNVVGIGDAENDHAFLSLCECSVAVADAVPTLKERADLVTKAENGSGTLELCAQLLDNDLEDADSLLTRHHACSARTRAGKRYACLPGAATCCSAVPLAAASQHWPPASSRGCAIADTSSASSIRRATTRRSREQ